MHVPRERTDAGLARANSVLNWRGVPENHPARDRLHQFRALVDELDRSFHDASREQIDALDAAHDRVSSKTPELLRSQSADELLASEAEILEALLGVANRHVDVWSALRTKIEASYSKLSKRSDGNLSTIRRRTSQRIEARVDFLAANEERREH